MSDTNDDDIVMAMLNYGGSFVTALARAFIKADEDNRRRLRAAFPEYWQHYAELSKLKAQQ